MTRRRFTDSEISRALEDYAMGRSVGDICRRYEISNNTFYRWKAQGTPAREAGPDAMDGPDVRALAAENRRLRRLLAEAMQEVNTLREQQG